MTPSSVHSGVHSGVHFGVSRDPVQQYKEQRGETRKEALANFARVQALLAEQLQKAQPSSGVISDGLLNPETAKTLADMATATGVRVNLNA